MPRVVGARDRYQSAQQPGVDRCSGCAARVEVQGKEADGDVQRFSRDLVPVHEGAPVAVDGDQAERRGRARYGAPVGGVGGGGGGWGEVPVRVW